eukprot:TRINITY_DN1912_c0_g2_i3.p1 TRINITY_DN1912_c0_g2~~TRINITY_DN1912_c0_g2_i3.p1  ORF type:complete len:114 (-),score=16.62 TRINITY_DN1912_c0_g2_i3:483-824(-)
MIKKKNKKEKKSTTGRLILVSSLHQIPHPAKKEKKGEDAAFITENGLCMGVFDGVGEWNTRGINPREYSEKLSVSSKEFVEKSKSQDPLQIMKTAYKEAESVIGTRYNSTVNK